MYPDLFISRIEKPNRLWAFPILGFLIKIIISIPVLIFLMAIGLVASILISIANPFSVLFTGRYMDSAYDFFNMYMIYTAKLGFFFFGLTDKYPGFNNFKAEGFTLNFVKPQMPNRLFAIPLFGLLVRMILLIPFFIYLYVLNLASYIGMLFSSFAVLFGGKYPESTYELIRDYMRVQLAMTAYLNGISDKYPSFKISMNHKNIKIALLIAGALWVFFSRTYHPAKPANRNTPMQPVNYTSQTTVPAGY